MSSPDTRTARTPTREASIAASTSPATRARRWWRRPPAPSASPARPAPPASRSASGRSTASTPPTSTSPPPRCARGRRWPRASRSARSAPRARDRPSNPTCTSACATPEAGTATAIRSACCPGSPPWEETRGRRRHRNPRRRPSRRSPCRRRWRAATVLRFVAPTPSGAACPRGGERRRVYATRAALPPRGRWPNRRLRPARMRRPGPTVCLSRWRERRRDPRPGTLAGERKQPSAGGHRSPGPGPGSVAMRAPPRRPRSSRVERAPAGPRPGHAELRPQPGGPDWGLVLACLGLLGAAALLGLSEDGRAASRRTGRRAAGLLRPLMGRR